MQPVYKPLSPALTLLQVVIAGAQLVWLDRIEIKGNCDKGLIRIINSHVRLTGCDVRGGKGAAVVVADPEDDDDAGGGSCSPLGFGSLPGSPSLGACTRLGAFNSTFHSKDSSGVQLAAPCEAALLGGCRSDGNGEGLSVWDDRVKLVCEVRSGFCDL